MARKEVNLFENYVDPRLEKRVREFVSLHPLNNLETSPRVISLVKNTLIREMSDIYLEDLNWNYLFYNKRYQPKIASYNLRFMYYLIDKGEFSDPNLKDIIERRDYYESFPYITSIEKKSFEKLNLTPWSICYTSVYSKEKNFIKREYFYINNADKQMYEFVYSFVDYYQSISCKTSYIYFTKMFEFYKGDGVGACFEDYNEEMFLQALDEALADGTVEQANLVVKFYIWIVLNQKDTTKFPHYRYEILREQKFISKYKNGFVPIIYNSLSPVPTADKWLIVKTDKNMNSQDVGSCSSFDFTKIKNKRHRALFKEFYWKRDSLDSLKSKNTNILAAINLDNSLNGQEYTLNNILNYFVQKNIRRKSIYREWLSFYNDKIPIVNFETLMIFIGKDAKESNPRLDFYTVDQKKDLIKAYKKLIDSENGFQKIRTTLCYYVFLFLYHTSMRRESILKLNIDSLIEFAEGKYYFRVPSKTSSLGYEIYNATKLEAKLFKEVVDLTEQFRIMVPDNLKKYVFLTLTSRKKSVRVLTEDTINRTHKKVCKMSGIPYLPVTSTLRNSFMNEMTTFLEKEGENDFTIATLTGHTVSVNESNYITRNLTEYSEKLYKSSIGNVPMIGQVDKETDLPDETIVEGIGHCCKPNCNLTSNLGCIACHNFIATISDIPAFEDDILELNKRIYEEDIQHEKEYLTRIRDIKANYLHQLYILKEQNNGTNINK